MHDATTTIGAYNTLSDVGAWKRYCVLYSEVGVPNWASSLTRANLPSFDPTKLLKVQWDMDQPKVTSAPSDVSLDNVSFVTREAAFDTSNNCNPDFIDAPPSTGNEG